MQARRQPSVGDARRERRGETHSRGGHRAQARAGVVGGGAAVVVTTMPAGLRAAVAIAEPGGHPERRGVTTVTIVTIAVVAAGDAAAFVVAHLPRERHGLSQHENGVMA
jgi:hypothetical protein